MDKKSKKQIEAELLTVIEEILVRHNAKAAGKVTNQVKASLKKIAKKFLKAAKAFEKKAAKRIAASKAKASKNSGKKRGRPLKVVKKPK